MSERRNAQCDGKASFMSWAVAVRRAKKRRGNTDEILIPYRCEFCRGIHIGTNPPLMRDRVRRKKAIEKARGE